MKGIEFFLYSSFEVCIVLNWKTGNPSQAGKPCRDLAEQTQFLQGILTNLWSAKSSFLFPLHDPG
jgi:hypothetical protein